MVQAKLYARLAVAAYGLIELVELDVNSVELGLAELLELFTTSAHSLPVSFA